MKVEINAPEHVLRSMLQGIDLLLRMSMGEISTAGTALRDLNCLNTYPAMNVPETSIEAVEQLLKRLDHHFIGLQPGLRHNIRSERVSEFTKELYDLYVEIRSRMDDPKSVYAQPFEHTCKTPISVEVSR